DNPAVTTGSTPGESTTALPATGGDAGSPPPPGADQTVPAPSGGPSSTVQGLTGFSIKVGSPTEKDLGAVASTVGIAGADVGNTDNQYAVMAAAINAAGGILGHKIVFATHDINGVQATSDPAAADAASCADLVDKKIFA